MALNLSDYEKKLPDAVKAFWKARDDAKAKQLASGVVDQGERAGVTGGNNLHGFSSLIADVVRANGLPAAEIHQKRAVLTLPGYFRPTKLWDVVVMDNGRLIAAVELKSQVGPSFGNNFNNRTEEAIGTSHDFWTAFREGAFGQQERPFLGWLMLIEDAPKSQAAVKDRSPHFQVCGDFVGASYQVRYDILCKRLMQEQLYSAAAVIAAPRSGAVTGANSELSPMTGLQSFLASLAGHVAAEEARQRRG